MPLSLATVGAKITATFTNLIIAKVNRMGLTAVVPTSVTGTGVSVAAGGKVTFTTSSAIQANGVFTSEYEHYLIVFNYTCSVASIQSMQVGSAGTAYSGAQYSLHIAQLDTTYATADLASQTSWAFQNVSALAASGRAEVYNPNTVSATRLGTHLTLSTTATLQKVSLSGGSINTTTQYTDLRIAPGSGTLTGTFRVYGYNDN